MAMIRTFIAIHLTPALAAALRQVQDALRATPGGSAGRWVAPENMHLTLKFLGDVESARLIAVYQAVDEIVQGYGPLTLTLNELGCFPNERQPRVIWVGINEPGGQLTRLAAQLDGALAKLGYARETRPFRPHLTLARVNERALRPQVEALGRATGAYQPQPCTMTASEVAVVRSDLRPQGPLYADLHRAPFGGVNPY